MTRTDQTRNRPLIEQHRSGGEYVLHSARMVGDEDDHAVWSQGCRVWRAAAATTVIECLPEQRAAFAEAAQHPRGLSGWKQQYEAEIRAVTAILELFEQAA
ncbi:MAG TPA: hypothetical protein VII01_13160 [Solirubrobacteraceae bacterium]|jgi:hypothetical protein